MGSASCHLDKSAWTRRALLIRSMHGPRTRLEPPSGRYHVTARGNRSSSGALAGSCLTFPYPSKQLALRSNRPNDKMSPQGFNEGRSGTAIGSAFNPSAPACSTLLAGLRSGRTVTGQHLDPIESPPANRAGAVHDGAEGAGSKDIAGKGCPLLIAQLILPFNLVVLARD